MLNFLFFVLLGLILAALLFERLRLRTLPPSLIALAGVFLLALLLAGAPLWGVFVGGLVSCLSLLPFMHPYLRRRFVLPSFIYSARGFNDRPVAERAWFDEEREAPDDKETQNSETSFLAYLNAGRFKRQFVASATEPQLNRDEEELLSKHCPRLCHLWLNGPIAERRRFIMQQGFANLENQVSSYAFFRILTQLAIHDIQLARTIFHLNSGMATLLATRGSPTQQNRFLTRIARRLMSAALVAPDASAACGHCARLGEAKGQKITGIWLEPGWMPLRGLPVMPDLCGLCLRIKDANHLLAEQEMVDICILAPTKVLLEAGLMRGEQARPAKACFIHLDQVIVLTAAEIQYVVDGRSRLYDSALLLAQTLRFIQIGGSIAAARMRCQRDPDLPLRAFADLRRLAHDLDAVQRFARAHQDASDPPFEADDAPYDTFNRANNTLMRLLPALAERCVNLNAAAYTRVFPIGEAQLQAFCAAMLKDEDGDQPMRADRTLNHLLSRWIQGIVRSFGLGISCGVMAAQADNGPRRSLAHFTAVFGCLFDTQMLLNLWRGAEQAHDPSLHAYHRLVHAYSMLMIFEDHQSWAWHPGVVARALGNWVDNMAMNRFLRVFFKWLLFPLGNIYGAVRPDEDLQASEAMLIPTAARERLLAPFDKEFGTFALTEELCKLAWAVKDLYETHALDAADRPKLWYDRLLKTKKISADEAKLLHQFYDTYQEVLMIYAKE